MGTEFLDQAESPAAVAQRQQTLAKQLDAHRRTIVLRQFLLEQRRQPIAAEHPAHTGARPGAGQEFVLLAFKHGGIITRAGCDSKRLAPGPQCDLPAPGAARLTMEL